MRRVQSVLGNNEDEAADDETPPAILMPGQLSSPEVVGTAIAEPGSKAAEISVLQPPATVAKAPTPLLLNRALQLQDAPVRVFGWIENSFTGNANGTPRNRSNFSVFPNHLANSWQGNQYYFVVEKPLKRIDSVNFGFRFDTLFGHDWQFTKNYGMFDRAFTKNHFPGVDLPQIYGEVHLPILTPRGVDLRGGRFYSLTGFESPQAIARPLLSIPYGTEYTPFTFFGAIATLHLSDRLSVFSGTINGFDRWINDTYKWGYLGAFSWTSRDDKTNLV
ncbi:MAG: outer membrane beta-barrel protein, partial [Isosphaeraceae bacterium]